MTSFFFNKNKKRKKPFKKLISDYDSFILGLTKGL